MPKQSVKNENKNERFKRIAAARTMRLLNDLRLLGNCSNTRTYSYTQEDVNKIFSALEKETRRVKSLFNKPEVMFKL